MSAVAPESTAGKRPGLRRTLTLPLLVFYGVGVTIGAGIFALIGEILEVSGDQAPLAFLVAGAIAGMTGLSYMQLVRRYPRAGGEAVYVSNGLGSGPGRLAGMGVVLTGTISSAVVSLAFGGYLGSLIGLPPILGGLIIIVIVAAVASLGVRESVVIASLVTVLEVGTLIVVVALGLGDIDGSVLGDQVFVANSDGFTGPILAGAVVAFFAFIGFEDIANMAEETVDPERTAPRAIAWTLGISIVVYVLLATIAVAQPERDELVDSDAPMATLFELVGGTGTDVVAAVASLAMTNGILVQVVMASRVLYGMAREGLLPGGLEPLGVVHAGRGTPMRATIAVCVCVAGLVAAVPLGELARITSLLTLTVFTLVNLALFTICRRERVAGEGWSPWAFVALAGAGFAILLAGWEVVGMIGLR